LKIWPRKHGRELVTVVATTAAAASFAVPAAPPTRWIATAVLLLGMGGLWQNLGPVCRQFLDARWPSWRGRAATWLPYLAVAAGTLVALGPVSLGEMPVSQDHANHYFFTEILAHDLLPSGRLFGWTDRYGLGYPFGDISYTLSYVVTGFAHLISFGLVDLGASYAFGICIVWLVASLAVVALARRLGAGPWGAGLAGLVSAIDPGSSVEGGWTWFMFHGVWPQNLATGVWVLALLALWRLSQRSDTQRLALAALLSGLSILFHPISLVTLLVAGALMVAVRILHRPPGSDPGEPRGALRLIAALALGSLIGLLWVVRMLVNQDAMWAQHLYWEPFSVLAAGALLGSLFDGQPAAITVLAFAGVLWVLRLRHAFGVFAVVLCATLFVIGGMELVLSTDLGLAGGPFKAFQYRRLAIAIKPFWLALAACGFSLVGRGISAAVAARRQPIATGLGLRIALAVALAPCVWGIVQALPRVVRSPAARPLTLARTGEAEHVREVRRILEEEKSRLGERLRRAVYFERLGVGGRYPMLAIADAGFGLLPTFFPPAQNFEELARTDDPETMRLLGASIVISRWPVKHDAFEEVARLGIQTVYRLTGPPPPPAEVRGSGRVDVISWGDEEKRLRVSGAGEGTSVLLALTPYSKWRAFHRQEDASPALAPLSGWQALPRVRELTLGHKRLGGLRRVELRGVTDGDVWLVYRDTLSERLAFVSGVIAFLICLAGLVFRPRPLPGPWSKARLARVYRCMSVALIVLALVVAVAAAMGGSAAVDREWLDDEEPGTSVAGVLHRIGPSRVVFEPESSCVRPYTEDAGADCSEADLAPRLAPAPVRKDRIPSCLSVGIPAGGRTQLELSLPETARVVKGWLHAHAGREVVAAEVGFGSQAGAAEGLVLSLGPSHEFRVLVPSTAETLTFSLRNPLSQPVYACIEAVALEGG